MGVISTSVIVGASVSIAASGASIGVSLAQKAKAQRKEEEALSKSKKAMDEAKRLAEIDYIEGLNIPLDAYGKEYEANLQNQKQSLEALQEGDSRNLAAGVGRVGASVTDANENTRIAMEDKMFELDQMQAQEKSRINQDLKDMQVGAAADQQMIARDSAEEQAAAVRGMVAAGGQILKTGASLIPLYGEAKIDKELDTLLSESAGKTDTVVDAKSVVEKTEVGAGPLASKVVSPGAGTATQRQREQWRNATPEQRSKAAIRGIRFDENDNIIW